MSSRGDWSGDALSGGDPPKRFYYIAHDVWGTVTQLLKEGPTVHLQYVPARAKVLDTAGKAGTWLGKNWKKVNFLTIIAHGSPGSFTLGVDVTADNVAPLGGWLYSFFEEHSDYDQVIQIIGCNAAADATTTVGKDVSNSLVYGVPNDLNDPSVSHRGYNLLRELARASRQAVEGPLNALSKKELRLRGMCRRVFPNGSQKLFSAG